MAQQLSERSQHVLKVLIERYISDGQPIGSKTLAQASGLVLSPATIRNVMADLEEHGLIHSPHTSAGRVPTQSGYRLFVDHLLTVQPLDARQLHDLQQRLNTEQSVDTLVDTASRMLSAISQQASLVSLPRRNEQVLRHLEFLPLSDNRVLAILVCNDQEVENRVIAVGRPFSEDELRRSANFINHHFAGTALSAMRSRLLQAMQQDKDRIAQLMQSTIDLAARVFDNEGTDRQQPDAVVAGEANLLDELASPNMARLRELFRAFEQKKDILHVMERCLQAEGTQIFIGQESGYAVLEDYSVITTPYQVGGDTVGVLGVIGPTRMAYERVIPLVDITARLLSAALERSRGLGR